ncbi:MAG: 50S ribosomal protein L23 [Rhodothermales bacterium]|nr:50S ribosomal protein L23 [Rhodothermales bacterium]
MSQDVLLKPLITEKLSARMEVGEYAFVVSKDANKVEIRRAVEARYPSVKIKDVRTMIVRGKRRTQQTRAGAVEGRVAGFKKAIVSLHDDSDQIDFFEEI